jgi:hypothetical protein
MGLRTNDWFGKAIALKYILGLGLEATTGDENTGRSGAVMAE